MQSGCNEQDEREHQHRARSQFVRLMRYLGGAQGRNRTTDTVIFSHVLYQLSYLGAGPARMGRSARRGRYKGSNPHCPERLLVAYGLTADRGAESLFQRNAIAHRKYAGRLIGGNLHASE